MFKSTSSDSLTNIFLQSCLCTKGNLKEERVKVASDGLRGIRNTVEALLTFGDRISFRPTHLRPLTLGIGQNNIISRQLIYPNSWIEDGSSILSSNPVARRSTLPSLLEGRIDMSFKRILFLRCSNLDYFHFPTLEQINSNLMVHTTVGRGSPRRLDEVST